MITSVVERGTEFLKGSLPKPLRREGMCSPKCFFLSKRSLTPKHLQPHPQPLSEWRGEWLLLLACKVMLNRNRGNHILELTKRPSPIEKGVSLCRKERLFTSRRRPLYLQTVVFTPLSIRRGVGGEAVSFYFSTLLMTLPFDSLRMLIPFAGAERRLPFKS